MLQSNSFKDRQLQNSRVQDAYDEKEKIVKNYFKDEQLFFEDFKLFIRAFKEEGELEVWIQPQGKVTYQLLHTYAICASSGVVGPKRKEGDSQVPEGVYYIQHFNPLSNFYLSLGINYPNASDKILSSATNPGSNIYIHGNCVTIGCIPLTDDKIKELYVLAVEARNNGQLKIPVHIFPCRLISGAIESLGLKYSPDLTTINFWKNLKTLYVDFEVSRAVKHIKVDSKGMYYL
jgi:murein L,D-transpeptidase YafK